MHGNGAVSDLKQPIASREFQSPGGIEMSTSGLWAKRLVQIVLLLSSAHFLNAQTTGVITGTVSDPSGAVVPNAAVVVKSTGTGEERRFETNSSGIYAAYALPVGQYDITVTAAGFKKAAHSDIQLNVADQLAVDDDRKPALRRDDPYCQDRHHQRRDQMAQG